MQQIATETLTEARDDLRLADNMMPELIADDDGDLVTTDGAWVEPGWREAAIEYHKDRGDRASIAPAPYMWEEIARLRRLMDDNVSLDRASPEIARPSGAVASTVEALMFSLRSRGVQALGEPDVLRRLAQLDDAQARDIAIRLQKLKPHIASAWAPEDVKVLLTVWSNCDEQDA
jgi:hypothetical protein